VCIAVASKGVDKVAPDDDARLLHLAGSMHMKNGYGIALPHKRNFKQVAE
jgi:uncharacterized iron-regulated protein